jgi:superfamily II DNA or RNA helicase
MERIQKTLNKHEIPQHRFTSKESTIPSKKLNGLNEREYIIKKFNQGYYKAIVAIKCLDEGVDLPSAETGIILSSTQNPREHIQRRGRLLRRYPGKERAIIYDILVFPKDKSNLTLEITKKEIERYEEFAKNAENSFECLNILRKKIEEI